MAKPTTPETEAVLFLDGIPFFPGECLASQANLSDEEIACIGSTLYELAPDTSSEVNLTPWALSARIEAISKRD